MSVLFEKTEINGMKLKNRLVRSATHEAMADDDGFPTDRIFKLYERLAKGGVGLIITGYTYVSRDGKFKSMLGIDSEEHIPKYRELVNQVHQNEAFAQAARRVKESGFDAVQLHGAHGYLINQFLCPHTNRREDKWGGTIENRMRFVTEIYKRTRKNVGDDYPIFIKLSAYDYMKNGLKPEEGVAIATKMADIGFDGIEVSCGIGEDGGSTLRGEIP